MISREMETYINFIWVHFYNVDFLGNRQNIYVLHFHSIEPPNDHVPLFISSMLAPESYYIMQ